MSTISVFACPRANLKHLTFPDDVCVFEVPCTGRLSDPMLLGQIAQGAAGVLILGRHQETCRFNGAETAAAKRVERLNKLLSLLGHGARRIDFQDPNPGPEGPSQAVYDYLELVKQHSMNASRPSVPSELLQDESLATSMQLLDWLSSNPTTTPHVSDWLHERGFSGAGDVTLFAGKLPVLSNLDASDSFSSWMDRLLWMASDLLRTCLSRSLGQQACQHISVVGSVPDVRFWEDATFPATAKNTSSMFVFSEADRHDVATRLKRPTLTIQDLSLPKAHKEPSQQIRIACEKDAYENPSTRELMEHLGYDPALISSRSQTDVRLCAKDREAADDMLAEAHKQGCKALWVDSLEARTRWSLLARPGSFRPYPVFPLHPVELAWFSVFDIPFTQETLLSDYHRLRLYAQEP